MRTITTIVLLLATIASLGATQGRLVCLKGMDMPTNDCPLCHASTPPTAGPEFSAPPGACCAFVASAPRAAALVQTDAPATAPVAVVAPIAVLQPTASPAPCVPPTPPHARSRPTAPLPLRL